MEEKVPLFLSKKELEHLLYVCEDTAEVYEDQASEEDDGGRPYVDRPQGQFLHGVSETLFDMQDRIKTLLAAWPKE